jgi:hypothetical protein
VLTADDHRPAPCPYCGQDAVLELFEVWSNGEFMLDSCCGGSFDEATERLNDLDEAAPLMRELGIETIGLGRLRRVVGQTGGSLVLDWHPVIVPVSQSTAKAFVRQHHGHCPPPAGWRFGVGLRNGHQLIGVVMVGRPVARQLDPERIVEVNRLCVRRDLPEGLTWNACSILYAWAAREARQRGFEAIVTYTLLEEPGITLRAAGWSRDGTTRGGSWSRLSRARTDRHPVGPKVRWSRRLDRAGRSQPGRERHDVR